MVTTVDQMVASGDDEALRAMWALLGGSAERLDLTPDPASRRRAADAVITLLVELCGGRDDPFLAERRALSELAKSFEIESARFPDVEPLEDAILEAVGERVEKQVAAMSAADRDKLLRAAFQRWSDEERMRLIEGVLEGYERMSEEARQALRRELATQLDTSEEEVAAALAGGTAALLPLLVADSAGFAVFVGSTKVMHAVVTTGLGVKLPFAVYMLKNRALGWLLGPVGMLVTTGASAGWWAYRARRRAQRMRKLIQVIAYTSAWRDERGGGGGGSNPQTS